MKVGVIGTGKMGENHISMYSTLMNSCQLIGVYDIDYNKALEIAGKYNLKAYRELSDLLNNVNAVSITTPTHTHFDISIECIKHHVHILVEKPITTSLEQASELIQLAHDSGVILQVGHIEIFNPVVKELEKILSNEKILAVDVHRLSQLDNRTANWDVVYDLMIHDIYILQHLLNKEIQQIFALGQTYNNVIKHAIGLLEFEGGIISQLTSSHVTEDRVRSMRIITTKAFIKVDFLEKKIEISRSPKFCSDQLKSYYNQQSLVEIISIPNGNALKLELQDFIDSVSTNREPKVTGEDGLNALKVADKISRLILNGDSKSKNH
ncbi:Gfo/Idh/MocA family protein [Pseudalkalibacillus hwajinpoensis]|uniref:Gfo/Idh/MocA family protein n=1 Tax=Guptibacillus hwajinpoensis TaxID=208199 RepID=UPI001CFE2961|nr:Gfo/Idh/MocA family oxidoreductase [Pseudalkalibacillus hwajinpoensis]